SLYFKGTIEREMITMSINQTNSSLNEKTTALGSNLDEVISWRRYLHQHPELSFEENETAKFIEEKLVSFGIDVKTNIGGNGLLGILTGNKPGKTIALRADLTHYRLMTRKK